MTGGRDANEVRAEQVSIAAQAVAAAQQANDQQQDQAAAWLTGGLPAGQAVTPGPRQHD